MNLSDQDILELNELCNALVDGAISAQQKERLAHWLAHSEEARRFYVRATGLSASLCSYAAEYQSHENEAPMRPSKVIDLRWWWAVAGLAAAACIVLALRFPWRAETLASKILTASVSDQSVAQLTGTKECQWAGGAAIVAPGGRLRKDQRIVLAGGFAEITFDSGAQIVLQGPASLSINSAWAATLNRGTLKASIPPEAMGFEISNPTVEVVDLGTEFTMFADATGAASEVLVLKGEVEAQPSAANQQPIVLREMEARRFAASGTSTVHDAGEKFARLTHPLSLDHFLRPTEYIHWSFDEAGGADFKADASGAPFSAADFHLQNATPEQVLSAHGQGHFEHALQLDGHFFAKAAFPDVSEDMPHTVCFWVKVPKDTGLSSAYAMVAWGMNNKQTGSHPVHIGWNRNPSEGPLGVLRTDYGGGFALGSTPLRDSRWHHIAVIVIPGGDAANPTQVKQYIDGRLEGEGHPSPPGSGIFAKMSSATIGSIWVGCRLGIDGVRQDRFRGELDELFIADRALEPLEIVELMKNNQLPRADLTTAGN